MTEITCFPAGCQKRLKRLAGRKKWARQIMPDWSRVRKLLLAGFPYMLGGPHHRRLIWGTADERLDEYPRPLDEGDVAEAGTGGGARTKNLAEKSRRCATACGCPGTPCRPSAGGCHGKPCLEISRAPLPKAPR